MKMPVKNEINNRYGRLVVLSRAENNHRGDAQWLCQCDCGKQVVVKGISLRSGHTQSCGCLQKEAVSRQGIKNTESLIGEKFGKLTVIDRISGTKDNRGKWICSCECGGQTITTTDKLKSGKTRSCGCVKSHGEEQIASFLKENNISFAKEFTFPDLKNKHSLRFDFALFKNNRLSCLLEFNGIQHYDKSNSFYSEKMALNDKKKNDYCKENNIKLFVIRYNENLEERMEEILCYLSTQNMEK